jgi:hypothetical protein
MRKKIVAVLAVALVVSSGAFSQSVSFPNAFGLGLSTGMRGGDFTFAADLTSPYLLIRENVYVGFRLSGDMLAKEGIPGGSTTNSIEWPRYFTTGLGVILARVPNSYMRLYVEVGGAVVFPTTSVASSTNPIVGIYGAFGGEFFLDDTKHGTLFWEVGDDGTFGSAGADKLQGAPLLGAGPSITAGIRYYF